jgi:hypothetical protein
MLSVLLLAAVTASAAHAPDPYAIFERARSAWAAQQYPNTVSYTITVTANGPDQSGTRHYHAYWTANDDQVYVKPPASDEQLEHPYKPSAGVNFMGWNIGGPREGTGVKDFIGVPLLAPNYSFGLAHYTPPAQLTPSQIVAQIREQYHDPAPNKVAKLAQRDGLKTIAMVTSAERTYRITLVGIESDGSGRDYHLALKPLRNPLDYRLRDLWIDTQSYTLRRARIGANFTDSATQSVPWFVRFRQVGGATYVAEERAEDPIVGYRGLMYSSYSVKFDVTPNGVMEPFATITSVNQPLVEP